MSEFRFKQFSVRNTDSALKVGTDAVLLGSLMTVHPGERRLLDIGTGTGVVALMAAQRLAGSTIGASAEDGVESRIIGIEIDGPSAEEARLNFEGSPWAGMLEARHCSLQDFRSPGEFDLIFSNPPYFDESLRNPDRRESRARHTESLSYREVLAFAREHLAPGGLVAMILPAESETAVRRCAAGFDLNLSRIVRIRTTQRKPPRRVVVEFSRLRGQIREEELTMQNQDGFTEEYRRIAGAFLLYL